MSPAEILAMAEVEGVRLGVRGGRLTFRGASHALEQILKAFEQDVVEALGGYYRSPQADLDKPMKRQMVRVAGRQERRTA